MDGLVSRQASNLTKMSINDTRSSSTNSERVLSLAHTKVAKVQEPDISQILVVKEFPDELPGLPPDREFDNVQLRTNPISINSPYRIGPNEIAELKK